MSIIKKLAMSISVCVLAVTASGVANAALIGTYTPGSFLQSGSFTNLHTSALTGVIIDLGVDAGLAGDGTPIWDKDGGSGGGTPAGIFSNPIAGFTNKYFTISFLGLNVSNGNSFAYSGLDIDGFTGTGIVGGGDSYLDGNELVTMLFADGSSVSAFLPAGPLFGVGTLKLDGDNAVVSAVPLPAGLPLYGAGLAIMGFVGWRRRRKS